MLSAEDRAALRILIDELGLLRGLIAALSTRARHARGEPFCDIAPPEDHREALSRRQIGPAIVLYRVLKNSLAPDRALAITRRVVIDASVAFLRDQVGPIHQQALRNMSAPQRQAWVHQKGHKFFNADLRWDEINADRVRFTVTRCHFPRLCQLVGEPHLAPLFCLGDAKFFGTVEPHVDLSRPHTIAEGAATCPFDLQWTATTE